LELKKVSVFTSDILFTGFYGQKNTGDDAFVEVAAWGAKQYWQVERPTFLARKNSLPITQNTIKGYPFTLPRSYHVQNQLLLRNTKCLISAGGSTIHSRLAKRNIKAMATELKRNGANLKLGGIGVSIGPFKNTEDEKAVAEYLKHLNFLAVRDQQSFEYVEQLDLPYKPVNAFDLAALLPEIYTSKPDAQLEDGRKVIGISVCPYESISNPGAIVNEQKRHRMLCELLADIQKKQNVHFKFLEINGHARIGDLELTKRTIADAKLKNFEIVPYQRQTLAMWNEVKSCDFMISTRLHAAIFACFAGVPFVLNEYHRKCADFLNTVGYHESYRIYDSEYSIEETSNMIVDAVSQKKFIEPSMKESVRSKARLNFTGVEL